jgi:hypothetical protein
MGTRQELGVILLRQIFWIPIPPLQRFSKSIWIGSASAKVPEEDADAVGPVH